jgi:hypothetical protein
MKIQSLLIEIHLTHKQLQETSVRIIKTKRTSTSYQKIVNSFISTLRSQDHADRNPKLKVRNPIPTLTQSDSERIVFTLTQSFVLESSSRTTFTSFLA